eukprot:8495252-Lingulodinium_polyedra.AAC.1
MAIPMSMIMATVLWRPGRSPNKNGAIATRCATRWPDDSHVRWPMELAIAIQMALATFFTNLAHHRSHDGPRSQRSDHTANHNERRLDIRSG